MRSETLEKIDNYIKEKNETAADQRRAIEEDIRALSNMIAELNEQIEESIADIDQEEYHRKKDAIREATDKREICQAKLDKIKNAILINEADYNRFVEELLQFQQGRISKLRQNVIARMKELNEMFFKESEINNEVEYLLRGLYAMRGGVKSKVAYRGFVEDGRLDTLNCLGCIVQSAAGETFYKAEK